MKPMNKKAFLARDWVVAAILFGGIIALMVLQVGDLVNTYDAENIVSEEFSSRFNNFENNTQVAASMWNKTTGEGGLSTIGTFDILFKSTFSVISLVFTSVTMAGVQIFGFTEYFGIPAEVGFLFGSILLSILSVIIVFIVISSVSRRDL